MKTKFAKEKSPSGRSGRIVWEILAPFGIEVEFDFRNPLSAEEKTWFVEAFYDHQFVLAKRQTLTLSEQQEIMCNLGPVLSGGRGMEYVAPNDGILNDSALMFHSDLAFAPEPYRALSLHAVDVVDGQTSTSFVSGALAYADLPDDLKSRIAGLQAVFVNASENASARPAYFSGPDIIQEIRDVAIVHPVTRRLVLYVSETHTSRIIGLDQSESDSLLGELLASIYSTGNYMHHVWNKGDLIMWDNISLQHARPSLKGVHSRKLQRAAVAERSLFEQLPKFPAP